MRHRSVHPLTGLVLAASLGCSASSEAIDDESSSTESAEDDSWFEVGWGELAFEPLRNGDELRIVWGSQGAAMFPMPIRGGNFVLPDDPGDYADEKAPLLDLELDIEGYDDGPGGHFKRIANYPLVFEILADGSYEFLYVPVIVPDHIDPAVLDGRPARLWVQLRPWNESPLETSFDLTVRVDDPP